MLRVPLPQLFCIFLCSSFFSLCKLGILIFSCYFMLARTSKSGSEPCLLSHIQQSSGHLLLDSLLPFKCDINNLPFLFPSCAQSFLFARLAVNEGIIKAALRHIKENKHKSSPRNMNSYGSIYKARMIFLVHKAIF